jgi:hypothetical protein
MAPPGRIELALSFSEVPDFSRLSIAETEG